MISVLYTVNTKYNSDIHGKHWRHKVVLYRRFINGEYVYILNILREVPRYVYTRRDEYTIRQAAMKTQIKVSVVVYMYTCQ